MMFSHSLVTVDEYRSLRSREDVFLELHLGQLVEVPRPKMGHAKLQYRLARMLEQKLGHLGVVGSEVAFRALPEYELRGADVAFVSKSRWDERATRFRSLSSERTSWR